MSDSEKLKAIIDWIDSSACPETFNSNTIEGINDWYQDHADLTSAQVLAINNIYDGYKIERWEMKPKKNVRSKDVGISCEACLGTGVAYWSDSVYGSCTICDLGSID